MRLPQSYLQINAAQERKLAELLSFVRDHVDMGEGGTEGAWFWQAYEIAGRAILHKRYGHLDILWHRGLERQTQHPVDYLYEFFLERKKDKAKLFLGQAPTAEEMRVVRYDESVGQSILEMFDHCQGIVPIYSTQNVLTFDQAGRIEGTPFDWYQLLLNYIVPVLIYEKAYAFQPHTELEPNKHFDWTGRMVYSLRSQEMITFIRSIMEKRKNGVQLYDNMEEYIKMINRHERSKREKTKQ